MNIIKKLTILILIGLGLFFIINHFEFNSLFAAEDLVFEHPIIDTNNIKCPATSTPYTPENTVFLVDFHRVIAQLDIQEALKNFHAHPQKFKTSIRLVSYLYKKAVGFKNDEESILEHYLNHADCNQQCRESNILLINSYKLDSDTVHLLESLRDAGYKLIFFSDMLPETLAIQQQRHPELFKLFYAINIREPKNKFASKLKAFRFIHLKETLPQELGFTPQHYIFLDDKKGNIKEAYKAGICSILFTNAARTAIILNKFAIL
ncbi:hypothetical protein A3F06_03670 [candidate division TM6 bacterium RIFCSPHIGHO2_12_FULL_36_22]|nr:MAG: hypothetical protein A3F06_03670 [candidate division TM6 bacterium RIFCSPHIGHO2_12_FULL_36_22]